METINRHPEPEYIKKMIKRANIQKIVGYLIYGAEVDPVGDCYEERIHEAYKKIDEIAKGNEKLQASINEVIANFSDIYTELGFKAGIMFMADIYAGRDRFGK